MRMPSPTRGRALFRARTCPMDPPLLGATAPRSGAPPLPPICRARSQPLLGNAAEFALLYFGDVAKCYLF